MGKSDDIARVNPYDEQPQPLKIQQTTQEEVKQHNYSNTQISLDFLNQVPKKLNMLHYY